MMKAGDVLDFSSIGATFYIKRTAADTDGLALEMEWELAPRTGGTPVHIHPSAAETYEVLGGELDVYVDGAWRTLGVGERMTVAAGIPHTFRNASAEATRVYNAHEPAMKFGEYFEQLDQVVNSKGVSSGRMTFKALIYIAMVMTRHEEEIRSVKPPHVVMRVLAVIGRLLGYRL